MLESFTRLTRCPSVLRDLGSLVNRNNSFSRYSVFQRRKQPPERFSSYKVTSGAIIPRDTQTRAVFTGPVPWAACPDAPRAESGVPGETPRSGLRSPTRTRPPHPPTSFNKRLKLPLGPPTQGLLTLSLLGHVRVLTDAGGLSQTAGCSGGGPGPRRRRCCLEWGDLPGSEGWSPEVGSPGAGRQGPQRPPWAGLGLRPVL